MFWLLKRNKPEGLAKDILSRLNDEQLWALRQALAGEDGRFYGDGGTIHHSTHLNVETHQGTVCAVWFRCLPIAFTQHEASGARATEMEAMYQVPDKAYGEVGAKLSGVEYHE